MGGAAALALNVESNSVLIDTQREVVTLGSSLVPREVIHLSGEMVPVLYDTGSSESILDCKLTQLANMDMMEQVIDPARVYMKDAIRYK